MERKFVLIIAIVLVAAVFTSFIFINKSVGSLSYEKCQEADNDDCWHSLAHETLNKSFCYKIIDNETMEHCLEHIPEINIKNK